MFSSFRPKKKSDEEDESVQVSVHTAHSGLPLTRRARKQLRMRRHITLAFCIFLAVASLAYILSSLASSSLPAAPSVPRSTPLPAQRSDEGSKLFLSLHTRPTETPATATTSQQGEAPPTTAKPYNNPFDPADTRTGRPEPQFKDIFKQYESGEFTPEEPEVVPGLRVHRGMFTPSELLERFSDSSIVYSFVNGTELNHYYRKVFVLVCTRDILDVEEAFFASVGQLGETADDDVVGDAALSSLVNEIYATPLIPCRPQFLKNMKMNTGAALLELLRAYAKPDNSDRETDELKHSLRSVEQHVRWHRGKISLVSPGHHPLWIDGAKNFLATSCGDAAVKGQSSKGTHLRLTTVHQDAIMPYGLRLTVNTNSIEPHLWRIKNITPVHMYYNDDYFVNRDVAITDLFNEYGGTIVRTEKGLLRKGIRAKGQTGTWGAGVRNTHLFNIIELDAHHEDYLPEGLKGLWRALGRYETVSPEEQANGVGAVVNHTLGIDKRVSPIIPPLDTFVDVAFSYTPEPMVDVLQPRRWRRFATHAPFVYCTNMWRYFEKRYEREFATHALSQRKRHVQGFYSPFIYNAFIMARPWAGSPKYLPYLIQLGASREAVSGVPPPQVDITLDNYDGCGPASLRGGYLASECVYAKFLNDLAHNQQVIDRLERESPLYFNINAGFSSDAASSMLRDFLSKRFPTPLYLERGVAPRSEGDSVFTKLYNSLMKLPVIAVTSFEEGVCPMVRSLQLALPDHTGPMVPLVARHGSGRSVDNTLLDLRMELRHRVRNAMPVVACAFNARVHRQESFIAPIPVTKADALSQEMLVRLVASTVEELEKEGEAIDKVTLPSVCGVAGGDGGDVRICAIVLDGRSDVTDALSLRHAVTMPGQTLALEDFDVVPLADGSGDSVLVLARSASDAKAVHWIDGAAESDLLATYPIPYAKYENLDAPLTWSGREG